MHFRSTSPIQCTFAITCFVVLNMSVLSLACLCLSMCKSRFTHTCSECSKPCCILVCINYSCWIYRWLVNESTFVLYSVVVVNHMLYKIGIPLWLFIIIVITLMLLISPNVFRPSRVYKGLLCDFFQQIVRFHHFCPVNVDFSIIIFLTVKRSSKLC